MDINLPKENQEYYDKMILNLKKLIQKHKADSIEQISAKMDLDTMEMRVKDEKLKLSNLAKDAVSTTGLTEIEIQTKFNSFSDEKITEDELIKYLNDARERNIKGNDSTNIYG